MGWARGMVGGREVGYAVGGVCEHPDCTEEINLGVAYACGEDHGDNNPEGSCGGYFCYEHLVMHKLRAKLTFVCDACAGVVRDENR